MPQRGQDLKLNLDFRCLKKIKSNKHNFNILIKAEFKKIKYLYNKRLNDDMKSLCD